MSTYSQTLGRQIQSERQANGKLTNMKLPNGDCEVNSPVITHYLLYHLAHSPLIAAVIQFGTLQYIPRIFTLFEGININFEGVLAPEIPEN